MRKNCFGEQEKNREMKERERGKILKEEEWE